MPTRHPGPESLPDFAEAVLDIVDQIPSGMVLAYADVAEGGPLAGCRVDMARARWDGQARPVDSDEAPTGAR